MRFVVLILGALALAACATRGDDRFQVGDSDRAFVIIGVAKSAEHAEGRYNLLWRRLDELGAFGELRGRTAFEAETNERQSLRVRGIPGEFTLLEIEPGIWALDSVFAIIPERRVNYVANGVIRGPERPTFEVRPGEAVYLGIWQTSIEDAQAVTQLWRLEQTDLDAVLSRSDEVVGPVRLRATQTRAVACAPHPLNSRTRRQVC